MQLAVNPVRKREVFQFYHSRASRTGSQPWECGLCHPFTLFRTASEPFACHSERVLQHCHPEPFAFCHSEGAPTAFLPLSPRKGRKQEVGAQNDIMTQSVLNEVFLRGKQVLTSFKKRSHNL
jgi:hypothetical protein